MQRIFSSVARVAPRQIAARSFATDAAAAARPFRILGLQQVALGELNKDSHARGAPSTNHAQRSFVAIS